MRKNNTHQLSVHTASTTQISICLTWPLNIVLIKCLGHSGRRQKKSSKEEESLSLMPLTCLHTFSCLLLCYFGFSIVMSKINKIRYLLYFNNFKKVNADLFLFWVVATKIKCKEVEIHSDLQWWFLNTSLKQGQWVWVHYMLTLMTFWLALWKNMKKAALTNWHLDRGKHWIRNKAHLKSHIVTQL